VPKIAPVVGVLHDSGRDQRMSHLKEDCGAAAEQGDDRRVADSADHAVGHEIPVPTRHPLGMSAGLSDGPLSRPQTHLYSTPTNRCRTP